MTPAAPSKLPPLATEMRSGHQARGTLILACECHEKVAGVITVCLEPHGPSVRGNQLMRELLARSVGIASDPFAVAAALTQGIEQRHDLWPL